MTTTLTTSNIQEVFTYPFRDSMWKSKAAWATLICLVGSIIPIVPMFFFFGYCYKIIERVIVEDEVLALPEWDDWGRYFKDGAKIFAASFIYLLPGTIMLLITNFGLMISFSLMDTLTNPDIFVDPTITLTSMGLFMGGMGLGMVLTIIAQVFFPVAIAHMISENKFSAAFNIRAWWEIFRRNVGGFLLSSLLVIGTFMAFTFASQFLIMTIVLCILYPIVWILGFVYVSLIGSGLYAQAYKEATQPQ